MFGTADSNDKFHLSQVRTFPSGFALRGIRYGSPAFSMLGLPTHSRPDHTSLKLRVVDHEIQETVANAAVLIIQHKNLMFLAKK